MLLKFTKMHGAGNDFVFINAVDSSPVLSESLARRLCDRRLGVGADQLLVMGRSKKADFRMDIFNADGGRVEMCGNGIRCLAKYVFDNKLSTKDVFDIETPFGIIRPQIMADHPANDESTLWIKVDMGEAVLEGKKNIMLKGSAGFYATCVSMGNPHAVIFVDDVDNFPVREYGPVIEKDPLFPKRTNVEFVEVRDKSRIKMRVWERGTGETLACGTGACSATVASVLEGKTGRLVKVGLAGGILEIFWDEKDNHVFMTGPAVTVFKGEVEV